MFFKRFFIILLTVLSLLHCGLEVGESPPSVSKYQFQFSENYCTKLNYKHIFVSYFFINKTYIDNKNIEDQSARQALICLKSILLNNIDLFKNESFKSPELINFISHKFMNFKNAQFIIDHIIHSKYFKTYILIKDHIIDFIGQESNNKPRKLDTLSHKNEIIFSKYEVEVFANFLKRFGDFLFKVDHHSRIIFHSFFSQHQDQFNINNLHKSTRFNTKFLPFLSKYLKTDFPEYANHLAHNLSKREQEYFLSSIAYMAHWPFLDSKKISIQNVKYIVLNIYIVQTLFKMYDRNKDFKISFKELQAVNKLILPLFSVLVDKHTQGKWGSIKKIYSAQAVLSYIIEYQNIPISKDDVSTYWHLDFLTYRFLKIFKKEPYLSYTDASQLISNIFLYMHKNTDIKKSLILVRQTSLHEAKILEENL